MRIIDLTEQAMNVADVLELAREGPVVLLATDGKEYILAEADDFDREVELLRNSSAFQQFLDTRSAVGKHRTPLADVVREIEVELAAQKDVEQ
jgi:hypothetical protein